MENRAQTRQDGATRRSGNASNTKAAPRRSRGVQPLMTREQTEGVILRMAAGLASDAARAPDARRAHLAYVNGAIALATALGVLTDARAVEVMRATAAVFDGVATTDPKRLAASDPAFAALVAAVRRNRGASLSSPLSMAQLSPAVATAMLGRLVDAGIVGPADLAGFHPVVAGEC
jgi:hypothetical protein